MFTESKAVNEETFQQFKLDSTFYRPYGFLLKSLLNYHKPGLFWTERGNFGHLCFEHRSYFGHLYSSNTRL